MPVQMILLVIAGAAIGFAIGQLVEFPAWLAFADFWHGAWRQERIENRRERSKMTQVMRWIREKQTSGW